ncbi:MAG: hypothetical protein ACMUEL_03265 [Flavobacteriales bacterium Tduv]
MVVKIVGLDKERILYKGLARVHAQHLMEAMEHNLYYSLGIIILFL